MIAKKKPETDKALVQVAARVPAEKYKKLKVLAVQNDKFVNDLLVEGIDYVLAKYSPKAK